MCVIMIRTEIGYSDHFPFHIVYGYYFSYVTIPKFVAILIIHYVKAMYILLGIGKQSE